MTFGEVCYRDIESGSVVLCDLGSNSFPTDSIRGDLILSNPDPSTDCGDGLAVIHMGRVTPYCKGN